ncbi:hypothetical protein [Enterobacter asburiae]|uniref:hypothetical protein n=1 Tax=Enterobacter asburiae TaxID=61645 RepID=UPI002953E63F|nr:hypothetical protein [Enterobacter asburiae]MDV7001816.1 hypothetical protein [Enterobacter asburiae]
MSKQILYVTDKAPVSTNWIPTLGMYHLIQEREVIKRTDKGYRMTIGYAGEKGTMFLDTHYNFFDTRAEALEFIASEANRIAGALDVMKQKAVTLLCETHDALRELKNEIKQ